MTFRAVILPVLCSDNSPWPLFQGFVPVVRGVWWGCCCSSAGAQILPLGGGGRMKDIHSWGWEEVAPSAGNSLQLTWAGQCAFHSGLRVTRASAAGTRGGSHFPYANSSVCLALLQTPPGS